MNILDCPIPSPVSLDEHVRFKVPLFDALRVELEFRSGDGVYERVYHLVEGVEEERDVDNE